jgi:hypothetical protein
VEEQAMNLRERIEINLELARNDSGVFAGKYVKDMEEMLHMIDEIACKVDRMKAKGQ